MVNPFLLVLLGIAGLVVGSIGLYLEPILIAHRLEPDNRPARNTPRSLLPILGVRHLTPVPVAVAAEEPGRLSFIWQALLLELAPATAFLVLGSQLPASSHLAIACLYTAVLFEIAVIDLHYRRILNVLSYPAMLLALACGVVWNTSSYWEILAGGAAGFGVFFVIELLGRGAMGRGDTKLAGLIGLMRGFPGVMTALMAGVITGGILAAGLLITGRKSKASFAYGPALAIGAVLSFVLGSH